MKKLKRDFITAWVLGLLLPTVLLLLLNGIGGANASNGRTETWEDSPTIAALTIPREHIGILVLDDSGNVSQWDLEDYLCGVVLAEMPADFEPEALKAQSVVARTYGLRRAEMGTKHPAEAVCMDPGCCQGYLSKEEYLQRGGTDEAIRKIEQAVYATAGEVLIYQGELIEATYFSCSGGMTEDAAAVWGSDVPYLQATVSPGEENARYFTDTAVFTAEQIEAALNVRLTCADEGNFRILSYTEGGGVDRIAVCGKEFTGVQVRQALGLRSTNFSVSVEDECICITTKGYGHRVGMSQYGAEAMALVGRDYRQILQHYYWGTELIQYRPDN